MVSSVHVKLIEAVLNVREVAKFCFFVIGRDSPQVGQGRLICEVSRSDTTTHHNQ